MTDTSSPGEGRREKGVRAAQLRSLVDLIAGISIIIAACVIIWVNWPKPPGTPPLPTQPLSLDGAATAGSVAAHIAIIEYSDLQCPYCGQFARTTLPELERRYVSSGRVVLAFRHLPLEKIHPFAFKAAEAAECSRRQGKFWEMHDRSFRDGQKLDEGSLRDSAKVLGLDMMRFNTCLAGEATAQVRKDMAEAKDLAVASTPTFFIGTVQPDGRVKVVKRLSGAISEANLDRTLDELLAPAGQSPAVMASVAAGSVGAAILAAWTIRHRRRRHRAST